MVPVIITKQHRYIRQFKQLEAISPGTAIKPEEYDIAKSVAFKKLTQQKIIIQTYDNHFYLDVLRADEMRTRRRVTILFLFIIIFSILIISLILIDYFTGDKLLMIQQW